MIKFTNEIGNELVEEISNQLPALPKGKVWIKYGKSRIYFNHKDDEMDYSFYINMKDTPIEIMEFLDNYWLDKIEGITSEEELSLKFEEIYYQVTYPPESKLPANTVREMRNHRRFEGVINSDKGENYTIILLPQDLKFDLAKGKVERTKKTPRSYEGMPIHRIVIKYEYTDEVFDEIDRLEDEADKLYMQQLQQSLSSNIKVGKDEKKSGDIFVDEGDTRKCLNCHKEFTYYSDNAFAEFCSTECKQEFQQEID